MDPSNKVVITCALTGIAANRTQCQGIPYTPVEIAEEARRAFEAGATVAHIHAREDDGAPSFRKERYAEIMTECRARSPIIINFSTGAIGIPMEDRVAHIRDLKPEIGALNMGSMNYAKFSAKRKEFIFDFVFQNPFKDIIFLLEQMKLGGVKAELECFDLGHIGNTAPLIEMGLLRPPYQFSLIMGVLGGIPPTTRNLCAMVENLPAGAVWEVIGISHVQWRLLAAGLTMGGNIRVGLEDNFYLPGGEMAKSNGDLAAAAAKLTRELGREVASIDEAREMLSIAGKGGGGR
jgi:3-keto-5-aminohexanoate cleavage enzyme